MAMNKPFDPLVRINRDRDIDALLLNYLLLYFLWQELTVTRIVDVRNRVLPRLAELDNPFERGLKGRFRCAERAGDAE